MADASNEVYKDLSSYKRLEQLIEDRESEGLYLECKTAGGSRTTKDIKRQLGQAVSGFCNTQGGLIIYGISTTKQAPTGLDVLTQLEPIGNIGPFEQQIRRAIPTVATPPILTAQTKILRQKKTDTRGIVVIHIPKRLGDPVM